MPSRSRTNSMSIETVSPGVGLSGVQDQYSDGKAAKNWRLYIGEQKERTSNYKNFLCNLLKENKATRIMDAACGTGVDSVMLIEEMGATPGFSLTSTDFSDQMLKYALETRWEHKREKAFFDWEIHAGNWMTLTADMGDKNIRPGFDAVFLMGNSFPNLMDDHGDFRNAKIAIRNFYDLLRPGGILIIDHRNYDYILKHGKSPGKNIYYNSSVYKVVTQIISEDNKAKEIVLNYRMNKGDGEDGDFKLHCQPYLLEEFTGLLKGVFGTKAIYKVFGDFEELSAKPDPAFYIHMIQRPIK